MSLNHYINCVPVPRAFEIPGKTTTAGGCAAEASGLYALDTAVEGRPTQTMMRISQRRYASEGIGRRQIALSAPTGPILLTRRGCVVGGHSSKGNNEFAFAASPAVPTVRASVFGQATPCDRKNDQSFTKFVLSSRRLLGSTS